jgi:uncharacterized membrane protein YoaK (UPF0700 family)
MSSLSVFPLLHPPVSVLPILSSQSATMPPTYFPESRTMASPYPENPFVTPLTSRSSSIMKSQNQEKTTYKTKKRAKQVRRYLNHELRSSYTSLILVVCFFTSGLVDSVSFDVFSCFVGMQTGNTVFAALGLSGQPVSTHRQQYYKSLVSIGSFILGTLSFNFLHRFPQLSVQPIRRRRAVFITSFAIQTLLILIAATLVDLGIVSNRPAVSGSFSSGSAPIDTRTNYLDLLPISLLAFQAAGQVCLSRVLEVNELPTIVLSTLYHDFTADLYRVAEAWQASGGSIRGVFCEGQRRQGRRAASVVALFLGGIVGGEMFKSAAGMSGSLFFAAGIKGCVCVVWAMWKGEEVEEDLDGKFSR